MFFVQYLWRYWCIEVYPTWWLSRCVAMWCVCGVCVHNVWVWCVCVCVYDVCVCDLYVRMWYQYIGCEVDGLTYTVGSTVPSTDCNTWWELWELWECVSVCNALSDHVTCHTYSTCTGPNEISCTEIACGGKKTKCTITMRHQHHWYFCLF